QLELRRVDGRADSTPQVELVRSLQTEPMLGLLLVAEADHRVAADVAVRHTRDRIERRLECGTFAQRDRARSTQPLECTSQRVVGRQAPPDVFVQLRVSER